MKRYIIMVLLSISGSLFAQKNLNKSIEANGIQTIHLDFKYPETVKISSWDKSEVQITGRVMINNGENDEAFKINFEKEGKELYISSEIEGLDDLPKRIMIRKDGENYYFPTDDYNDPKVQQFLKDNGDNHQYQMHGVIKEITLVILVPRKTELKVVAKYGLVELKDITAPIEVDAKYGGVDLSISPTSPRNVTARTKFGEIYSDLDFKVNKELSEGGEYFKWTTVAAQLNGGGTTCLLTSKFGNVYIRKQ